MKTQIFDEIPGLFLFTDYFPPARCNHIIHGSLELYKRLEAASVAKDTEEVHIPQPEFVRSAQHNLSSEEAYIRVELDVANQRKLRCEYFPNYGEEGHALAYFRGNANLPDFIDEGLLTQLHETMNNAELATPDKKMQWKLTANYYKNTGNAVAGFPFHVDIPANGVVTMILNIQREAQFQIAKDEVIKEIQIPIGGLLVLSGESRYAWKHRVLPMQGSSLSTKDNIERISLVLGFK